MAMRALNWTLCRSRRLIDLLRCKCMLAWEGKELIREFSQLSNIPKSAGLDEVNNMLRRIRAYYSLHTVYAQL